MFPGQGSQALGMGAELFSRYPEYVNLANESFKFDLLSLCHSGPENILARTDNAQAVIYVVNALNYMSWLEENKKPDIVLGHSSGQYNAMLAAGMINYQQGLDLVKHRGQLMAQVKGGAMAAVMRISVGEIIACLKKTDSGKLIDIANDNSEQQVVISGPEHTIDEVTDVLQQAGGFVIKLKTSGAFHSRYLTDTKSSFMSILQKQDFAQAKIKLICNVTASDIKDPFFSLAEHLTSQVKWRQSIYHILGIDINAQFVECGQGSTLTNMLRYNKKEYSSLLEKI
ncbi:MAG: trans-AT polyketide synthase/acyltransferase/oxidoreductase domain-containing protein [Cognaticolwellia sp.]|jgi:trans-AT polyketide synthase/acyltransferase/oxidoreductase domain-containing protein